MYFSYIYIHPGAVCLSHDVRNIQDTYSTKCYTERNKKTIICCSRLNSLITPHNTHGNTAELGYRRIPKYSVIGGLRIDQTTFDMSH